VGAMVNAPTLARPIRQGSAIPLHIYLMKAAGTIHSARFDGFLNKASVLKRTLATDDNKVFN
jgi:hypothetical protein